MQCGLLLKGLIFFLIIAVGFYRYIPCDKYLVEMVIENKCLCFMYVCSE